MHQPVYTDYFGQPLQVGCEVVYPISNSSSRASLIRGKLVALIDLVPHRDYPGTPDRPNYMRADQASKAEPTVYRRYDVTKPFVVQVEVPASWWQRKHSDDPGAVKLQTIRFVENLIRVPA